jgi:HSP20 family protein
MRYIRPRYDAANKRFSELMDDFFNDAVGFKGNSFVPSIDISETDKEFLITAELPGMKKEDIDISVENGHLVLRGERKAKDEEEGKTFHRIETSRGSFERSFQLPDYVDEETINAGYKDGLLNISMGKGENKVKKQIEIK